MMPAIGRTLASAALALCLGCGVAAPRACAQYPAQPGPETTVSGLDAGFLALFRALANQGSVRSEFTEFRWFPFRAGPVVLEGEMRFSREFGLSLRYTKPVERIVIADSAGIVLRDASGRSREIEPDGRMPDISGALVPILRFDTTELFARFRVHAARLGNAWRIDLVSRDAQVGLLVGGVTIEGTEMAVRRIDFIRSPGQRIEIRINSSAAGVKFGTLERTRYFR
jgi:hypothetical protein